MLSDQLRYVANTARSQGYAGESTLAPALILNCRRLTPHAVEFEFIHPSLEVDEFGLERSADFVYSHKDVG